MKLAAFFALLLSLSTPALAELTCEKGEVLGYFRVLAESQTLDCPSKFSVEIEGREYCINEESNISQISTVMEGFYFRDVAACTDWDGNIQKIEPGRQRQL